MPLCATPSARAARARDLPDPMKGEACGAPRSDAGELPQARGGRSTVLRIPGREHEVLAAGAGKSSRAQAASMTAVLMTAASEDALDASRGRGARPGAARFTSCEPLERLVRHSSRVSPVSSETSASCICGGGAKVVAPRGSQSGARSVGAIRASCAGTGTGAGTGANDAANDALNDASPANAAFGDNHTSAVTTSVVSTSRRCDGRDRIGSRVVWISSTQEGKQSRSFLGRQRLGRPEKTW